MVMRANDRVASSGLGAHIGHRGESQRFPRSLRTRATKGFGFCFGCVSEDALAGLKQRIGRFVEEMLEQCDSDPKPERVYQLCIQLYPMSQPVRVDDSDVG